MAKILIVDDDLIYIRIYQLKLKSDGHTVETANNGEEAIQKVNEFKPDLILLDIMMPKIDGFEVLKQLKANPETKTIPVILLTNLGGEETDTLKGIELGAVAYLVKSSYTPKEVVEKVKEILAGYSRNIPEVKTQIKPPSDF